MAPKTSTTHDVMRDASEFVLSLVSDTPFDSDLTATGDAISATISEAHVEGAKGAELAWLLGATVSGRITRVEHRKTTFLFAVAFETLDVKGVVSPFYAKLIHNPPFALLPVPEKSTFPPPIGHGRKDWSASFIFDSRASHYVLRAPFESKRLTTPPDAAN